jgi:cardiolipin synthase (CMP-forming)
MHIPNIITFIRIALVPLCVWLIISEAHGLAFITFMVAGASDFADGFLARRYNWHSKLGAYLDPLADKSLMASVYVTLGVMKDLPAWLVILVVSRDALIVAAVLVSRLADHPVHIKPLMVSKVNTAAQIVFVVAVLGLLALDQPSLLFVNGGGLVVALLTAASGGAYLMAWLRHMAEHPAEGQEK